MTSRQSEKIIIGPAIVPRTSSLGRNVGNFHRYINKALIKVSAGKIAAVCDPSEVSAAELENAECLTFDERYVLIPGFVDTHIHYAQLPAFALAGGDLLQWLDNSIFPQEALLADREYSHELARIFFDEIFRNGTTTVAAYCTSYAQSADAFFTEASRRNARVIAGNVLMDRNVPERLAISAADALNDCEELIEKWHGNGRNQYAVTPRFAPSCSPDILRMAGDLLTRHHDIYLQTHLSETIEELEWVRKLFPGSNSYTNVYADAGLLTNRSIFGHAIHLSQSEIDLLSSHNCAIAHCPLSNSYLGSGLFKLRETAKRSGNKIRFGLGTDIGAGPSFSILDVMGEAYKVSRLVGSGLSSEELFSLATIDGARALSLEDKIGSIEAGKEADFVVIRLTPTEPSRIRDNSIDDLFEKIFGLCFGLGRDAVAATIVDGQIVYSDDRCFTE